MTFPHEISQLVHEFSQRPLIYDEAVLANKWNLEAQNGLKVIAENLPTCSSWEAEEIKHTIHASLEAAGIKMGKVMQMLRVALSGNGAGPDLMISMQLWGKEESIERLNAALSAFPKLTS
mgnify:FL=1